MKLLFVHQNFPGQFKHLAAEMAKDQTNQVVALTMSDSRGIEAVRVVPYQLSRGTSKDIHPWVAETETKVIRGEAAFRAALGLRAEGFSPDVIVAHPGWGESLFLKEVWPAAKLLIYCEFYYATQGADIGFDPEFPVGNEQEACRVRMKNANNLLHFQIADAGISPTHWQKSTFPEPFRSKIDVVHDGIDTSKVKPNPKVRAQIGKRLVTRKDEIITFVNRNLEPYRGYHVFMRCLPKLLKERPNAMVLIVGGDDVSYGAKAPTGETWKSLFFNEVKGQIDTSRVHFLGKVGYEQFLALLQLSTVHVYLTYPFVLSWSLLEAMSCECAIVASDTQPLQEVITDGETGLLTPFFDTDALSDRIIELLRNRTKRAQLGRQARQFVIKHYDLQTVALPRLMAIVNSQFYAAPESLLGPAKRR
jgi:glycosyltransferase involved in cell wall biosynthesis